MKTSQGEIKYCLESSFIIDLLNGKTNAVQVYKKIKNSSLTITSIASVALFEILRGKEQNQNKINEFNKLRKKLEVLPFGEREAIEASKIEKSIHKKKETISPLDLLIGTTAKTNKAILISNDADYKKIEGLQLLDY